MTKYCRNDRNQQINQTGASDPKWNPLNYVEHLKSNNYRMYIPTLDEDAPASGAASSSSSSDLSVDPTVEPWLRDPPSDANPGPYGGKHGPYKPYHQVLAEGKLQKGWKIPINSYAKNETVHACSHKGCLYFAKNNAERDRHRLCHHPKVVPVEGGAETPPAEESLVVPAISLDHAVDAFPLVKKRKRPAAAASAMDEGLGSPRAFLYILYLGHFAPWVAPKKG